MMGTYYYMVCRPHNAACGAYKNAGIPLGDAHLLSTWLAEHCLCEIRLLSEHDVYGEGYHIWTSDEADEFLR